MRILLTGDPTYGGCTGQVYRENGVRHVTPSKWCAGDRCPRPHYTYEKRLTMATDVALKLRNIQRFATSTFVTATPGVAAAAARYLEIPRDRRIPLERVFDPFVDRKGDTRQWSWDLVVVLSPHPISPSADLFSWEMAARALEADQRVLALGITDPNPGRLLSPEDPRFSDEMREAYLRPPQTSGVPDVTPDDAFLPDAALRADDDPSAAYAAERRQDSQLAWFASAKAHAAEKLDGLTDWLGKSLNDLIADGWCEAAIPAALAANPKPRKPPAPPKRHWAVVCLECYAVYRWFVPYTNTCARCGHSTCRAWTDMPLPVRGGLRDRTDASASVLAGRIEDPNQPRLAAGSATRETTDSDKAATNGAFAGAQAPRQMAFSLKTG